MPTTDRFPVVGIGASAGGVEALQEFFRAMPAPAPAMAFVVVTHLGAGHESALPEILQKCTAMPVLPMRDGGALQPGHAYVAPRDAVITLAEGRLVLRPQAGSEARERQLIDLFFASLAVDQREEAIGVVLSGSGSDGSLGLKAIKEAGGLTMAQGSNGTAPRYPGMPSSAVAAGVVDLVIPVESMPGRLAAILEQPAAFEEPAASDADALASTQRVICDILRGTTGHDFSDYKDKTFFRRVQRRMQATGVPDLPAFVALLRRDADEVGRLFHDLLISVTGFFRDAEAFEALEAKVMPAIFAGRGVDDTVRIWVPGCATGEEAYSLAILAQEQMARIPTPPRVQIFATDIDDPALSVARLGRYPKSMMAGVSAERLARFFLSDGALHTIRPETRELCVFSSHNVIRDAPFSRIDLVSCRNMLIYMGGRLQEQVIPLFHYALRPSGFLFLGVAETVTRHPELFAPVDKAHRIFRKREGAAAVGVPRLQPGSFTVRRHWHPPAPPRPPYGGRTWELQQIASAFASELFAPPHLLVNGEGNIVHQSTTRLSRYLELPAGPPSHHLVSLARRGLRPELRAALREAVETRRPVVRPRITFDDEGTTLCVDLTVAPLPQRDGLDPLYLVAFAEQGAAQERGAEAATISAPSSSGEHLVEGLEAELRETRERLQSMAEEYETATEELKSANEEMVSVNEELQSINEELETSKEELQSVNEELRTSNLELSTKIEQLDRVNADLRNLFDSTQVATVFLDRNLAIRSFTPAVTAIFDLVPADRGRSLSSFASHLDGVEVGLDARRVIEERTPAERRVTARNGVAHYLMRILPYTTASGDVDGVVVTFFDVTKVVEGEILGSLVDELNHRVRNMLQVVSAVAAHTLRRATSLEDFGAVFAGRIRALARAHELVSIGGWAEVPLMDLIRKELEPYAPGAGRLTTLGRSVHLRPRAALALGMVLHELATNAAKHGALGAEGGRVAIAWSEETRGGEPRFVLRWTETGGPKPDPAPTRQGFGSELIEREVRHDLAGTLEMTFGEEGLVATIVLPRAVLAEAARGHRSGGATPRGEPALH
ncbi:chemotaxis protein CheB [Falsiroseomonas oryzae]|uniref:chemotaxis protein CheB n=1 Tax=Falsiroseomonas oryzae TaxID=2766473 RepID=UPI0022EAAA22|nr:chemotaxis protein CheB [Roseomonas sp. MO-31]